MMAKSRNGARSWIIVILAALTWAMSIGVAQAVTCTYSNGWDTTPSGSSDDIIIAASNLTWSASLPSTVASWTQTADYNKTVMFQTRYGTTGFTNFTVSGDVTLLGGTWTHTNNTTAESYRLRVTVGGNLLVTNATISANGIGYSGGQGPGAGTEQNTGGAYGGASLGYLGAFNAKTYGSIIAPMNLGSGGKWGGAGAGAILLTVVGTTTVAAAGMISANGGTSGSGAGSGGSIYLTTGWLAGSGTIRANGGTGDGSYGGGGGGRVALILTGSGADFTTAWNGTNVAYGGTGGDAPVAAGTVYRKTQAGVDTLIIDNNNKGAYGQISTLMPPAPNAVNLNSFSNVVIRNKGILGVRGDTTLDFNTFTNNLTTYGAANSAIAIDSDTRVTYPANWIINGYTLYVNNISTTKLVNLTIGTNGVLSHYQNYASETYKINLTIAGNLTVLSNGTINADALGYSGGNGPGCGTQSQVSGAYGGAAVNYLGAVNAKTYGSIITPTNLGSGGMFGGYGGGAILLTVAGTTTVATAGIISANGGTYFAGAGSGGSLYLTTGWLNGSGTLRANGASGPGGYGGAGGGRAAIVLTGADADFSLWTGTNSANGGSTLEYAAAGTVYRQKKADPAGAGTVTVDNRNTAKNASYTALPAFINSTENISKTVWVTTNNARLGLVTNTATVSLTLNTGGRLELAGYTLTVKALTVTNKVYRRGVYTPADISLLTDAGSNGKVVVAPPSGTLYVMH